jgi:hypothetical protein
MKNDRKKDSPWRDDNCIIDDDSPVPESPKKRADSSVSLHTLAEQCMGNWLSMGSQ